MRKQGKNTTQWYFEWDLQRFRRTWKLPRKRLAYWLGISERDLKKLESSKGLIPDPLPEEIAQRFNSVQRVCRSLAGRMHVPSRTRKRGRQPGSITKGTEARLTIAAALRLGGERLYSMGSFIFPEQRSKDNAYASTKVLFGRHKKRIEMECARLKALPLNSRQERVRQALQYFQS